MSKHSPGPWRRSPNVINGIIDRYERRVAEVFFKPSETQEKANRDLVSAAPELLEALEMVRDAYLDCKKDGIPTPLGPAWTKIVESIAKAKGETG